MSNLSSRGARGAAEDCTLVQVNLNGKVLIFPTESTTAYVSLCPTEKKPLSNFTLCMKAFTDLTRPYSLFSYSTHSQPNELLLFVNKPGEYLLYIANSEVKFTGPPAPYTPLHVCVSWESESGIAELWVNGKPLGRKGVRKGYSLGAQAKIFLGQEQDSFGGGFEAQQSFVGEIWDVSLWDKALSLKGMCSFCSSGNLLNWHHLNHRAHGYVVTKPKVWA
ncbi:PREDICTED: mucosal pentraxin-like [Condylura cristata]|uniref:mucosal pentraxin-like n=1 Tax=Condylura cristata TaxID=143302 RepID=UPI0003344156|nr:PREDICTED: mucosal pentraxin-like [Condylura cristata]